MSIHFISGKPGGGKSLYAMRLLQNELVNGTRPIVTNLPLKLGELNAYLQRVFPDVSIDLFARIQILDEFQSKEFWCFRGPARKEIKIAGRKGEIHHVEGVVEGGVFYIMDEFHNYFNAREWMNTGTHALYYCSQHRKLGDDVICITQFVGNVDKQFRSMAQDFTYCVNQGKKQMAGFRLPKVFTRRTYPSIPGPNDIPMLRGTFRLDVSGLASCYDTAAGVGIVGRDADLNAKVGGWPLWLLPVFALAAIACVWFLVVGGSKAVAKAFHKPLAARQASTIVKEEKKETKKEKEVIRYNKEESKSETNKVYIVGWSAVGGGRYKVLLSDKRVLSSEDLVWLTPDYCVTKKGGERYEWR